MIIKKIKRFTKDEIIPFFQMLFYNTICKGWIELFGTKDKRKLKYNISLCLIFKNEAPFLKEWLDYHITVGIDHFYLYNNNSDDNYLEIIQPYIDKGYITLIDWPENNAQFKAYKHCFETYKNQTNWISFLDADEFICPKYSNTIGNWLEDFSKYHAVNLHWLMFCTGGNLKHDYTKNVIEQYYSCWENLSPHGKCIINTRFEIANFDTWYVHHHTYMYRKLFGIKITIPAINQFGYMCIVDHTWGGGKNKLNKSTIQINHYFTKSWDIWSSKMQKTDVYFKNNPKSDIKYFYRYENRCVSKNYTIQRFYIKMKLMQGIIQ